MDRLNPPDLRYSDWHRRLDRSLGMIDLDAVECCRQCWAPVALIELAGWGTGAKPTTTLVELARRAHLPAYTVRVEFPDPLPTRLSVRRHDSDEPVRVMTPDEYERFLLTLRAEHHCTKGGHRHVR